MKQTRLFVKGKEVGLLELDMKTYRKRPVEIVAKRMESRFKVETLEGTMEGKKGDWLIVGVEKEMYPCANRIFIKTYEEVED